MLKKILITFLFLSACSHPPKNSKLGPNWDPPSRTGYNKKLRKLTKRHREYNGLSQVFEAKVTFLTEDFRKTQLRLEANFMNWSQQKAENELVSLKEDYSKESNFLINFFTPDPRKNKLDKAFADWSVILTNKDGEEVEGIVSLHENDGDHIRVFYPNLHTWSRVYMVTFPIPTKNLESQDFSIKVIGPLGMGIVDFKAS